MSALTAPARIGRLGLYAFLIATALFFAIPLLVVISTSLKSLDEIRGFSIFVPPSSPHFAAWWKAWYAACTGLNCGGVHVGFWNSVRILIPSVTMSVLAGALNGYALSHWRVPGADLILLALLLGAFIPYQVILYPMVKITSTIGIYSSLPGIIAVHILFGLPVMTLLFRNFYSGLPNELVKAARVDGAGFWRIFASVMLPLSVNILIVATILQTTGIWNDYLLGLIFAGRENQPMTVQLNAIATTSTGEIEYNVNMAAALLTALPPLLVYFASGRFFVRGITAGAVKGLAMTSVVVRGLSKSYGPVEALRGIDMVVEPGDFAVLLGPSGCGKSSLLNAIAGLDDIDAGSVEIGGVEVTQHEPSERGIAMVFQSYALYPTMTVRRNLSFGLRVRSVPKTEIQRRVA